MPDDLWKPETGPENRGRRKAWGALPPSGAKVVQVDYDPLHRRKNRRSSSRNLKRPVEELLGSGAPGVLGGKQGLIPQASGSTPPAVILKPP